MAGLGTRERMLIGAVEVMRERGASGVTVDEVLARSGAPRGSVYHHFPNGRGQIVMEALDYAGAAIDAVIEKALQRGSLATIDAFTRWWTTMLEQTDFNAGCPVMGAAVGAGPDDAELAAAAGSWFTRWTTGMEKALIHEGIPRARAKRLAALALTSIEGAIAVSKSTASTKPLKHTASELKSLLKMLA
ncbi:TetR/AcrR family transcriptional regulator [Rhodococcus qingshengii]|uniref:TetR/AcrR family transcriptional regulator n=1 Tax=Rhodococcus qingshengii TaxID=334542 RepID=UPI00364F3BC3